MKIYHKIKFPHNAPVEQIQVGIKYESIYTDLCVLKMVFIYNTVEEHGAQ
jgi:hypothetical protein